MCNVLKLVLLDSDHFKETLIAVSPSCALLKHVFVSFLMPVILCTQIVPIKSAAFEGASQILSAALISRSDSFCFHCT